VGDVYKLNICERKQKNVTNATRQNSPLSSSANRHGLSSVDTLVRFATKEVLDCLDHLGYTGHTAHEDDLLDVARFQAGITEGVLAWHWEQIPVFQAGTSQIHCK
jgi:hypothetical protein